MTLIASLAKKEIIVKSGFQLDAHLFSLLAPLIFIAIFTIFRKKLLNSLGGKISSLSFIFGLCFVLMFCLSVYDLMLNTFQDDSSTSFTLEALFYNIDTLLLLVFAILFIFRIHSIIRLLTPFTIIVGLANLINNPGAHLTYTTVVGNVMLCVLPLLIVLVKNKVSSFKELLLSMVIALLFLVFVSIINSLSDSAYSLIGAKVLSQNKVYKLFPTDSLKIVMFIIFMLLSQIFAWFVIKSFMTQTNVFKIVHGIGMDIKKDKQYLLKAKNTITANFFDFETPEFFVNENSDDELLENYEFALVESPNTFSTEYVYNYHSVNLPEIYGARSPSL